MQPGHVQTSLTTDPPPTAVAPADPASLSEPLHYSTQTRPDLPEPWRWWFLAGGASGAIAGFLPWDGATCPALWVLKKGIEQGLASFTEIVLVIALLIAVLTPLASLGLRMGRLRKLHPGPLATAATFSASAICAAAAIMLCVGVAIDGHRFDRTPLWTVAPIALFTIATSCIFFLRLCRTHAQPLIIALLPLLPVQLGLQIVILVSTSRHPSDPGWIAAALSVAALLFEIPYLANRHLRSQA